ncbi:hypothetical protein DBV39_03155 [Orrella marina]|uniref:Uncharacterized protein n=1 Tax=Orrella marina TaxID=2163011 RepID=A0A2R4XGD5_9BURK|nr:hypothetical protein DBV39_03155 [Orrella marina]
MSRQNPIPIPAADPGQSWISGEKLEKKSRTPQIHDELAAFCLRLQSIARLCDLNRSVQADQFKQISSVRKWTWDLSRAQSSTNSPD